jgi:hypothetical protein
VKNWTLVKKAVSWLIFVWGTGCGVLALAFAGYVPHNPVSSAKVSEIVLATLGLALFCFVPLLASWIALRNRRQAALLFLIAGTIAFMLGSLIELLAPACSYNGLIQAFYCFREIAPGVLLITAPIFLVPGLFWWLTAKLKWGPLVISRPIPVKAKIIRMLGAVTAIFLLVFAGSAALELDRSNYGECNYFGPPLIRPRNAQQAVFIGSKVHSVGKDRGTTLATWQIATVDQRFWGIRPWERKFVLVRPGLLRDDKPYLIDGQRPTGLLTRFLPIFEIYCTHTKPVGNAGIDLRLLHDGPPKDSARIIGVVLDRVYTAPSSPVSDAKVIITGPSGTQVVRSNSSGIYDAPSVPPGHYKMTLESADQTDNSYFTCERDVQIGEVGECLLAEKSNHP